MGTLKNFNALSVTDGVSYHLIINGVHRINFNTTVAIVKGSSKSILIVEDELIIALMIEQMVQNLGHTVLAKVTTGEAAVEAAREHNPDIILMDIRLQGEMDGIEAISEIRRTAHIPVIYISGNSDESYRKRVEESEPLDFLTKPITLRDLSRSFSHAS